MQLLTDATAAAKRHKKRILLILLGTVQVAAGGVTAVAPHLATILGPKPFAIAMVLTGIGSAVLAFVKTELSQEQ